jgi:hypothetical protein
MKVYGQNIGSGPIGHYFDPHCALAYPVTDGIEHTAMSDEGECSECHGSFIAFEMEGT